MRIAMMTLGTRGDLQPFIALGLGLKAAGHELTLISSKNDAAYARSFGLNYRDLNVDIQQTMEQQEVQAMTKGDNPIKFFRSHLASSTKLNQLMLAVQEELWQGCEDQDVLIYHPGLANVFYMAQQLGIPSVLASPFPLSATGQYPSILFYSGPRLGTLYNLATHLIFEVMFWMLSRSASVKFWQGKGKVRLPVFPPPSKLHARSGLPVLYGYSEKLFPKPKNWKANLHVTGYWQLPENPTYVPPTALEQFLSTGEAPIYMGFGSIKDPGMYAETLSIFVQASEISARRVVIGLGWNKAGLHKPLPESVLLVEDVPHSWLFPRMAAIVHHGGAGTTAAGLVAGKPTIIVPHTADQPAWGRRVFELGVGPKPIPRRKLTAQKLALAISEALKPEIVSKAAALGEKLRQEDGVGTAVQILQAFFASDRVGDGIAG